MSAWRSNQLKIREMTTFQFFPDVASGMAARPVTWIDDSKLVTFSIWRDSPCRQLVYENNICFHDKKKETLRNKEQLKIASDSCERFATILIDQLGLGSGELTQYSTRERRQVKEIIDSLLAMVPLPPIIRDIAEPVVAGTFNAIRNHFKTNNNRIINRDTTIVNVNNSDDEYNRLEWCSIVNTYDAAVDFGAKIAKQHFEKTFWQLTEISRHNFEVHNQIELQLLRECEGSLPINTCSKMIHSRLIQVHPLRLQLTPTGALHFEFQTTIPTEVSEAVSIEVASATMINESTKIRLPRQLIRIQDGVFEPKSLTCIDSFCKAPALHFNKCATGIVIDNHVDCVFDTTEQTTFDSATSNDFSILAAAPSENCRLCSDSSCSKMIRSPIMINAAADVECVSASMFINHKLDRNNYEIITFDNFKKSPTDDKNQLDWITSAAQFAVLLTIICIYNFRSKLAGWFKKKVPPTDQQPAAQSNRDDVESHVSVEI